MDELSRTVELVEEKAGIIKHQDISLIARGFAALLELYRLQNERIDELEKRLYSAGLLKEK